MNVTYDQDVWERSKRDGKGLFTIDLRGKGFGGITIQGPCSKTEAAIIRECIEKIQALDEKKAARSAAKRREEGGGK